MAKSKHDSSLSMLPSVAARGSERGTRAEERAAVFSNLGRDLSGARSPEEAARTILQAAEKLFHWDACVFDLFSSDLKANHTVLCMDTVNGKKVEVPASGESTLGTMAQKTVAEGAQLILRSPKEGFPPGIRPLGDKARPSASLMYAPLRKNEESIGLLSLQSYTPNAYTKADLNTLQALADHCGGTLERIRAEKEMKVLNIELEKRVRERTAQLESINQELEAFCYSVSHDLRAPLRSIRGFSEVLLDRYAEHLDARGQEFLRRACQSAQHMDRLIEDLLSLSRVSRAELQRQPVNLSTLAENIAADLRKGEPGRQVEFVITPNLRTTGDGRLLRVALDNLMQNAWKFTARKPQARIEFGATAELEPAFFVRDNGAGFDAAYAEKLFGVFQRLHAASDFPGTGVGLATVKRIINRHGGRTWATATVNEGAIFYFTVPRNGETSL